MLSAMYFFVKKYFRSLPSSGVLCRVTLKRTYENINSISSHTFSVGLRICLQCRKAGFNPWVRKIPWRREWQPTPVLLPGESHGQRSLVGYSPWGGKESDTTERLHFHFSFNELNYCKVYL